MSLLYFLNMTFSRDDTVLIFFKLRPLKGYNSRKLMQKFPCKRQKKRSLNYLLKSCESLAELPPAFWKKITLFLHIKTCSDRLMLVMWLVAWHSSRTLIFDRPSFPVLHSTCTWRVTTYRYVGKPSAIGQPTRPTHPFIISG